MHISFRVLPLSGAIFFSYGKIPLALVHKSFEQRLNRPLVLAHCSQISPFRHMLLKRIKMLVQIVSRTIKGE